MRAIGIDPGLAATGYAIVEIADRNAVACTWGCIRTNSKNPIFHRLGTIHEKICNILQKWSPEILIIEDIFVKKETAWASIRTGEVKGAIYIAAYHFEMRVLDISPTEVKRALSGSGRASKEQIEKTVRNIFKIKEKIKPGHASDALAIALSGIYRANSFCGT